MRRSRASYSKPSGTSITREGLIAHQSNADVQLTIRVGDRCTFWGSFNMVDHSVILIGPHAGVILSAGEAQDLFS